jgi:hypothetical protein
MEPPERETVSHCRISGDVADVVEIHPARVPDGRVDAGDDGDEQGTRDHDRAGISGQTGHLG